MVARVGSRRSGGSLTSRLVDDEETVIPTSGVDPRRVDAVIDDAVERDLELRRTLWLRQHPDVAF